MASQEQIPDLLARDPVQHALAYPAAFAHESSLTKIIGLQHVDSTYTMRDFQSHQEQGYR